MITTNELRELFQRFYEERGHLRVPSHSLIPPADDLSNAALEAVSKWRYSPTLLNGEPIDVETAIEINFTLRR